MIADTFTYPFSLELTYNQTGTFYDYGVALDHAYSRYLTVPGVVGRTVHTQQHCEGSQVRSLPQPTDLLLVLTRCVGLAISTPTQQPLGFARGRRPRLSRTQTCEEIRSFRASGFTRFRTRQLIQRQSATRPYCMTVAVEHWQHKLLTTRTTS